MSAAASVAFLAVLAAWPAIALAQAPEFPLPPKTWDSPVADMRPFSMVLLDRLEYQVRSGANGWLWDGAAWFGGDFNKVWLKSEGESTTGEGTQSADVQVLYARRISPYWYVQAGARNEVRPSPSRTTGVLAIQGLAPYWFNVQASAFLGRGLSGRVEAEYDQLITQRLVLQPRLETNFSTTSDHDRGEGAGLRDLELGLTLRYEIRREIAPYIGVSWRRKFGTTASLSRQQGENPGETAITLGIRLWY